MHFKTSKFNQNTQKKLKLIDLDRRVTVSPLIGYGCVFPNVFPNEL